MIFSEFYDCFRMRTILILFYCMILKIKGRSAGFSLPICVLCSSFSRAASKSASILIPSPNVTGNHQAKNALSFVENGAGILINETDLSKETLTKNVQRLIKSPEAVQEMSANAYRLSSPQCARIIVSTVQKQLKPGKKR